MNNKDILRELNLKPIISTCSALCSIASASAWDKIWWTFHHFLNIRRASFNLTTLTFCHKEMVLVWTNRMLDSICRLPSMCSFPLWFYYYKTLRIMFKYARRNTFLLVDIVGLDLVLSLFCLTCFLPSFVFCSLPSLSHCSFYLSSFYCLLLLFWIRCEFWERR